MVDVADGADSPSAGGNGDGNDLRRALLRIDYQGDALLTVVDPVAAAGMTNGLPNGLTSQRAEMMQVRTSAQGAQGEAAAASMARTADQSIPSGTGAEIPAVLWRAISARKAASRSAVAGWLAINAGPPVRACRARVS